MPLPCNMPRFPGRNQRLSGLWMLLVSALSLAAASPVTEAQRTFFENKIRPKLATECYACHGAEKQKGGLRVDFRDGLLKGGDSGPAILPGNADRSLLVQSLRHTKSDLAMPKDGAKFDKATIDDFVKWVNLGAPDPRDHPPTAAEVASASSWEAVREQRKQWWSFQPVKNPPIPATSDPPWSDHPVDRFLRARLEEKGLSPAATTDPATLIRRLSYVLTGLPPTPEEVALFVNECRQGSTLVIRDSSLSALTDRLLASPHFGERWARHWMDWVRYADSHGSEGDPAIPYAWQYRDYLIRALNADVPLDDLIRENIAGDLLPQPRVNPELGLNESALGIAQYRFVQHGFTPTDALDELVRFTDEQIDVVSKAFLGLTVSCARCHDHKFDAISQKDFYALYGIMASCRPATLTVDTVDRSTLNQARLQELKLTIRQGLADAWLAALKQVPARLIEPTGHWQEALNKAEKDALSALRPWLRLRELDGESFVAGWQQQEQVYRQSSVQLAKQRAQPVAIHWNLASEDAAAWFKHGNGSVNAASAPGGFSILPTGDLVLEGILPGGVYSHLLSTKHSGIFASPRFKLDAKQLFARIAGDGGAIARYVVQNYPRTGTVYPQQKLNDGQWRWIRWDVNYWHDETIYLEVSTAADQPVVGDSGTTRSWFGVREFLALDETQLPPRDEPAEVLAPLFDQPGKPVPTSAPELAGRYTDALRACVMAWRENRLTDDQAMFLDFFVRHHLLPDALGDLAALREPINEYRRLENVIPVPTRSPGVLESDSFNQPLFIRGDHKQPAEPVPRRFLEALDPTPYRTTQSGRLQLADDLVRPDNPFTARVMANRIWHHVFGMGLVATPDNLGRLGEPPTHPELLDHLATQLRTGGWSLKSMLKELVATRAFRLSSTPSEAARDRDPANQFLSHAHVRRLEAEAIRDAMLDVSGRLNREPYGPSVAGNAARRSVYVRVIRNSLDDFLSAFDAPAPVTTKGRRDVTNVPAQSLMLMNDPFVIATADAWVERLAEVPAGEARLRRMFAQALSREPLPEELAQLQSYLASARTGYETIQQEKQQQEAQLAAKRAELEKLTSTAHRRVLNTRGKQPTAAALPQPVARWDFEQDARDQVGTAHGSLHGQARIAEGALVVNGQAGYFLSEPLSFRLREKTLLARVQLDTLEQAGGGIMTVQTPNGVTFDAIVYGEKAPREWVPGSNNFSRSENLGGPKESEAAGTPVWLAIAYDADRTVRAYRNGQPYGKSYVASALMDFKPGETVVTLGLRHLPAVGNRLLKGRIFEAHLYDRALTGEEIAAIRIGDGQFVSEEQLLAAMTDAERTDKSRLDSDIAALETSLNSPQAAGAQGDLDRQVWRDLALALFNFKEFIYLR